VRLGDTVVAKGANDNIFMHLGVQNVAKKMGTDFASSAGYQNVLHRFRHSDAVLIFRRFFLQMQSIHVEQKRREQHHTAQPKPHEDIQLQEIQPITQNSKD
jgi:hypothetical protein